MNDRVSLRPIGVIRTHHQSARGTPIQPNYARESVGEVEVDAAFAPALADLEGFDHIWLLYWFDRAGPYEAQVVPYRDRNLHGLFATRAPSRPNPIGLSVVRLCSRKGNVLHVKGIDVLDKTPLLDIKPYVPDFDSRSGSRAGWLDARHEDRRVADERFHTPNPQNDGDEAL